MNLGQVIGERETRICELEEQVRVLKRELMRAQQGHGVSLRASPVMDRIERYLKTMPHGATSSEIAAAIERSQAAACVCLTKMVGNGRATRSGTRHRFVYGLPAKEAA